MTEEQIEVMTPAGRRSLTLRTPSWLGPHPAVLLSLCGSANDGLNTRPYCIAADIFLAAGHRAASLDLPNHGPLANHHGEGLAGIVNAMRADEDPFGDFAQTVRLAIDTLISRDRAEPGLVVIDGTSRGALAALHAMARDPRIRAAAVHAPAIDLGVVREFAAIADHPAVRRTNAVSLLEALVDRPLLIAVGETDPRVDAGRSFEFHARLTARASHTPPTLFTAPGQSHGATYPLHAGYNAAAGFLLQQTAQVMKSWPGA